MKIYKYIIKDESTNKIIESGTGDLFDLQPIIPIEILSILELYEDEKGEMTVKVRAGNLEYDIIKIRSICA
ncbi:hypothetical protein HN014_04405 [Aquimarina sp. TRL1]|uniref:hypothetical protein n=1 Tax=Aquimarina sp. (strain TRL1) TaxID=2736252 RepID=UPI00158F23C8|nr:hypothetical protein [Aquimarina sp. TRL1]QKX04180.1 hypothetical protein HN014_04405 [Aquimarina sp. TRL1]